MMEDNFDNNSILPDENDTVVEETEQKNGVVEADNNEADDKSSISSDLIRGHINTIILRSLYERDKYGYEIINDIERKSHNQYTLKQPTLYSALKRLENQGYLIAYWKTDEVSSGGRRKYFTLTDSGKEITEKNLAEWEYSRTIIDNLISDRSFDFSQPAPTPVDFTILRNSVSRVPIVHDEAEEQTPATEEKTEQPATTPLQPQSDNAAEDNEQEYVLHQLFSTQNAQIQESVQAQDSLQPTRITEQQIDKDVEARRQVHENYLRLISEPVSKKNEELEEDVVPNSQNVQTSKLLYNVKPNTERDYKNLINGIYDKAISNGSVQTNYARRSTPQTQTKRKYGGNSTQIIDRGIADGVRITPSFEYDSRTNYATKTTYNKGLTLLMCSGIVLFILLVEFIFCLIFKDNLQVSVAYPIVILLIGIVQFAVFGVLALQGYGANCAKPMSNSYISKSIILAIILILIVCISSFLFKINFTRASDVMKLIVVPSITVLNIVVFAVSFKLLTNK